MYGYERIFLEFFLLKMLDISLKILYNYNSQLIKLKIFKLIIDKNFKMFYNIVKLINIEKNLK